MGDDARDDCPGGKGERPRHEAERVVLLADSVHRGLEFAEGSCQVSQNPINLSLATSASSGALSRCSALHGARRGRAISPKPARAAVAADKIISSLPIPK
jgi:hypothetical protein